MGMETGARLQKMNTWYGKLDLEGKQNVIIMMTELETAQFGFLA